LSAALSHTNDNPTGDAPSDPLSDAPPPETEEAGHVSLKDLIDAGVLKPPVELVKCYKDHELKATILGDGTVTFQGKQYETCSAAAVAARCSVTGKTLATSGWDFWQYTDANGNRVPVKAARQAFLAKKAK